MLPSWPLLLMNIVEYRKTAFKKNNVNFLFLSLVRVRNFSESIVQKQNNHMNSKACLSNAFFTIQKWSLKRVLKIKNKFYVTKLDQFFFLFCKFRNSSRNIKNNVMSFTKVSFSLLLVLFSHLLLLNLIYICELFRKNLTPLFSRLAWWLQATRCSLSLRTCCPSVLKFIQ